MFNANEMTKRQANALVSLKASHEAHSELSKMLADSEKQRVRAMSAALKAGIPQSVVGGVVGMTKGRIWQIVNGYDNSVEARQARQDTADEQPEKKAPRKRTAAKKAAKKRAPRKATTRKRPLRAKAAS